MERSSFSIRRWVATVVVIAAFAGGALLSQGFRDWAGHTVLGSPREPIAIAQNALPVSLGNFANGFSAVIKPALPAVVNIRTSKMVKTQGNQMSPFFNDPTFRQFFRRSVRRRQTAPGARAGSGFGRDCDSGRNNSDEQSRN